MGYNFEPIHTRARSPTENPVILRGTPISYTLKAAVARNTTPALELTQVIEGDPTQKEFLETKGHSVHHVCYYAPDIEQTIAQFKQLGIDVIQRPVKKHTWAMLDTQKMCGYYIEIHE
jgi:hypothetical protein